MTQLKELSKDPFYHRTIQSDIKIAKTLNYLKGRIRSEYRILDIGQRNPLTEAIEQRFGVSIDSTTGDLDEVFMWPGKKYDVVIYSHTIEHQFNPLSTLLRIRDIMLLQSRLYIFLPNRPKFLWFKGHFHEIDNYRMGLLIKRAGFRVISVDTQRVDRGIWFYFTGLRPLLRLFLERNVIYDLVMT